MTVCGCHVRPGVPGLIVGLMFFLAVWLYAYMRLRKERAEQFEFAPAGALFSSNPRKILMAFTVHSWTGYRFDSPLGWKFYLQVLS